MDNFCGVVCKKIFNFAAYNPTKSNLRTIAFILSLLMATLPLAPALAQDGDGGHDDPVKAQIDSLISLIKPDTPDTTKARLYLEASHITSNTNERYNYSKKALSLRNNTDTALILMNSEVLAYCYYAMDDRDTLLPLLNRSINLAIKSNNLTELHNLYRLKSMQFDKINMRDSAINFCNQALEVSIRLNDTSKMAACYLHLGNLASTRFYEDAEINYKKALVLDSILGDRLEVAIAYYSLGELYALNYERDYYKAKDFLLKSIDIFDAEKPAKIRYVICKYLSYNALADVYIKLAKKNNDTKLADSCQYYNKQAMDFFLNSGYINYYCYMAFINVDYLMFCKKYKEALNFLHGLKENINPNCVELLDKYYGHLRKIYYAIGDYKKAYDCFEENFKTSTSLYNDTTLAKIADAKAEQIAIIEKLNLEKAEQLHKFETSRLHTLIISLIVGLALVSLLVFYILTALRIRQKSNEALADKNHEISMQKDIIVEQWHDVESANKKLLGSINYAKRIQYAAISKQEDVKALFPDCFIYYRPRDIVSGDFYYVAKCGRYSVMITADCTGHGIPGAFLSMLGISAVKEYCVSEEDAASPGIILDHMRSFIKATLVSETPKFPIDDGMDMTICCYDFEKMELRYAAANQTAYLMRRGKVIKLKGDRMPVGRYIVERDHFHTLVQPLEKGDVIYSCSDGIQDQIGGQDDYIQGVKMQANTLIEFLLENYTKPMDEQSEILDTFVNEWRNGRPQVDDMTLIGVRV